MLPRRFPRVLSAILLLACPLAAAGAPDPAAEADRLLAQMTTGEKLLQLLAYQPNGVPRLGIPNLQAGEALHGVVSEGCTVFPQSIALGATFDPGLVYRMAVVIGKEARAVGMHQCYSPMLAVARDARWGRVEESYGESPLLVARMGVAYIEGVQGTGEAKFGPGKLLATPKHMVADGEPWAGANGEGFETSMRVLREIHMPPFEAAVKVAGTASVMPAHHSLDGVPCHANHWLLEDVLRREWGFKGFVTSDMGDIPKLGTGGGYGGYRFVRDDAASAVASLNAGVDMELIGNLYMKDLPAAIGDGRVAMQTVERAAKRVLEAKLRLLGLGAPAAGAPEAAAGEGGKAEETIRGYQGKDDIWAKLIAEGKFDTAESGRRPDWQSVVNDPAHDALALELAEKAVVLLKNDGALLPLDRTKTRKLLVTGPLAVISNIGGYSTGKPKFFTTIIDGLKAAGGGTLTVEFEPGCADLPEQKWGSKPKAADNPAAIRERDARLTAEAVAAAASADVIIAYVGHTRGQLGENLDRDDLGLPGGQQQLVEAMHATGKPVIVIYNGGNVFASEWIAANVPAIIQAFYLGQATGTALAKVLFGDVNPGGKMPLTTPRNAGQCPWYYNHPPLTGPINYYGSKGGPLQVFGHGLSYTTFRYSGLRVVEPRATAGKPAMVAVKVKNTGPREGDEVVQMYLRQDYTSLVRPVRELAGFERLTLKPGEEREVAFLVGHEQVKFWKDDAWTVEAGTVNVMIGSSSADIRATGTVEIAPPPPGR